MPDAARRFVPLFFGRLSFRDSRFLLSSISACLIASITSSSFAQAYPDLSANGVAAAIPVGPSVTASPSTADGGNNVVVYEPPRKPSDAHATHDMSDSSGDGYELLGIIGLLTAPFWGPPLLTGDTYSEPGWFAPYPYYDGNLGRISSSATRPAEYKKWGLYISTDYMTNMIGASGIGTRVMWDFRHRFGMDAESNSRWHKLSSGATEQFWNGDVNLTLCFAQSEYLQTRFGAGINWLDANDSVNIGTNFTYGIDWFICRPLVLTNEFDYGTLAGDPVKHVKTLVGVQSRGLEAHVGFEYFEATHFHTNSLVAGLRAYF